MRNDTLEQPRAPCSRESHSGRRASLLGSLASFALLICAPLFAAADGGRIDPAIVGAWVHETQINSGGADFAGFATVRTLELGADGQVRQWVQSAGGGSDWSYGSGGPELEAQGQWYADGGIVYVRLQGQPQFVAASRYRLAGPYLVTENVDGRINWRRR